MRGRTSPGQRDHRGGVEVSVRAKEGLGGPWKGSSNPNGGWVEGPPGTKGKRGWAGASRKPHCAEQCQTSEDGHLSASAKHTLLPGYAEGLWVVILAPGVEGREPQEGTDPMGWVGGLPRLGHISQCLDGMGA